MARGQCLASDSESVAIVGIIVHSTIQTNQLNSGVEWGGLR